MKQIVYTQEQIDKISAMLNVVTVFGTRTHIDCIYVLSCSLVAGIASLLLSINGLPIVSTESEGN